MAPKLILYFASGSPPARACLLLLRYLKLDVEVKDVDLVGGAQHDESYAKLNPQKKVPVLVDGNFTLSESRAILAYLVNKFSPGSDLYPSDPEKRANVDSKLYYDCSIVFERLAELMRAGMYRKEKTVAKVHKDAVRDCLKALEAMLENREYFAGENLTIADFSINTSVLSFYEMGFDFSLYPKLVNWMKKLESLPSYEENLAGAKAIAGLTKILYPNETIY